MFRSLMPKLAEPPTPSNDFDLDFRIIKRVGGRVYKAIHDSGKFIAVKKIPIPEDGPKENQQVKELEEAVRNLQMLSHPNIIQYLGTRRAAGTLYILMEIWGTSLFDNFALLNETKTRRYTIQLLQGLKYLHERNIVHGNIKGANIRVDASGDIKLADFGLSAHSNLLGGQSSSGYRHVTEIFQPPPHLDPSADIWCVGCTLIELTTGKDPWSRESWSNYLLPKKFSLHAKNFLDDCLQWEQQEDSRLATAVLLQTPFLNPAAFDVRPTQLLPRESLVAEVLYCSSPSPNYAAAAAARLNLEYNTISKDKEAAEPPTMLVPKQVVGDGDPASLILGYNVGSTSNTNSESISSSFDSGFTSVSEPSSHPLSSTTSSSNFCPEESKSSNTSGSKSVSTLVSIPDPNNNTSFQEKVHVRKRRRFKFLKFLWFWSP